jgi:hypothetical protein
MKQAVLHKLHLSSLFRQWQCLQHEGKAARGRLDRPSTHLPTGILCVEQLAVCPGSGGTHQPAPAGGGSTRPGAIAGPSHLQISTARTSPTAKAMLQPCFWMCAYSSSKLCSAVNLLADNLNHSEPDRSRSIQQSDGLAGKAVRSQRPRMCQVPYDSNGSRFAVSWVAMTPLP